MTVRWPVVPGCVTPHTIISSIKSAFLRCLRINKWMTKRPASYQRQSLKYSEKEQHSWRTHATWLHGFLQSSGGVVSPQHARKGQQSRTQKKTHASTVFNKDTKVNGGNESLFLSKWCRNNWVSLWEKELQPTPFTTSKSGSTVPRRKAKLS